MIDLLVRNRELSCDWQLRFIAAEVITIPNLKKADWEAFHTASEVGNAAPDTITEAWIEEETTSIT